MRTNSSKTAEALFRKQDKQAALSEYDERREAEREKTARITLADLAEFIESGRLLCDLDRLRDMAVTGQLPGVKKGAGGEFVVNPNRLEDAAGIYLSRRKYIDFGGLKPVGI